MYPLVMQNAAAKGPLRYLYRHHNRSDGDTRVAGPYPLQRACWRGWRGTQDLEAVDLNGLRIQLKAIILVGQKFLNSLALVTLELDDLAHLRVGHDGAIASELLLNDLQNLLAVKFGGNTLHCSQGLTSIALLDTDVDVFLSLLGFSGVLVGFGEGVKALEVFDGHKLLFSGVLSGKGSWKERMGSDGQLSSRLAVRQK
jgi:hypothetical protein